MSDNSSDTRSGIINPFIILHSRLIDKFMQFLALLGKKKITILRNETTQGITNS